MVGLVGSGNIARALARGWGEPVLCTDAGSGRAAELAREVGGEALASNAELAEHAELVVLCHKPEQLEQVANDVAGRARAVASLLAGVTTAQLADAYPDTPVFRLMPNTAIEVRRGVICYAPAADPDPGVEAAVLERFARVGRVVHVPEALMEVVTGLAGCGPAFFALVAEAQVEAGVSHGVPPEQAAELVGETVAGFGELLRARGYDAPALRHEVTSPGGLTERGLAALERAGVREAFGDALDAVAGPAER